MIIYLSQNKTAINIILGDDVVEDSIKMLTVDEVKEVLKLGKDKVYAIFRRDDFPAIRIGKRFVVEEGALKKWLQERRI